MQARIIPAILALTLAWSVDLDARGERIEIRAELASDSEAVEIFEGQVVLMPGETREIFTGPHTVQLSAQEASPDTFEVKAFFFGLGPKYNTMNYNIRLAIGDSISLPPLPVKDNITARYALAILDDTTTIDISEPPLADSMVWGMSESVHYTTRWMRGSLADFLWNVKMGYLERIYDNFRNSFSLTSSEKIEYIFHPGPADSFYINPARDYAIQPRKMRIDVIFGHERDGVMPDAAAELLIYKLWGYGPRWMAAGFAGYYGDNFLRLRKFADRLNAVNLGLQLADEAWVDTDTGRIVTGALARWLVDSEHPAQFMELYRNSTSPDFAVKFTEVYGRDLESVLADFITHARGYKPQPGELAYYASLYMDQGDYAAARGYFEELVAQKDAEGDRFWQPLKISQFWLGDYDEASKSISSIAGYRCDPLNNVIEIAKSGKPLFVYGLCITLSSTRPAELYTTMASYHLDEGNVAMAESMLVQIKDEGRSTPEYFIEAGRLNLMKGQPADSLLGQAAAMALSRAAQTPHDPINYLVAGQALALMGDYGMAQENLETAHFLETRPYFLGQVLLELGKLSDLKGERDRAREYYDEVSSINAGAYQKALTKRYLETKYKIGQ
jgi:tetratricopeptide (TPR) repeat protein